MDLIIEIGSAKIGYLYVDGKGATKALNNEPSVILEQVYNLKTQYVSCGVKALETFQKIRFGDRPAGADNRGTYRINDKIIERGIIKDYSAVRFFILEICSFLKIKSKDVNVWVLVTQAMDAFQRETTEKLFRSLKFKRIYVLDQTFAFSILFEKGIFIDIGKDKTEIAVVNKSEILGGLVVDIGLTSFVEEFVNYCKNKYRLFITNKEALKAINNINSVVYKPDGTPDDKDPENRVARVQVSNLGDDGVLYKTFTTEDTNRVIGKQMRALNDIVCNMIALLDDEVREEVKKNVICFGGAFVIFGLNYMLRDMLGVNINLANNYKNYSLLILASVLKNNRELLLKKLLGD